MSSVGFANNQIRVMPRFMTCVENSSHLAKDNGPYHLMNFDLHKNHVQLFGKEFSTFKYEDILEIFDNQ